MVVVGAMVLLADTENALCGSIQSMRVASRLPGLLASLSSPQSKCKVYKIPCFSFYTLHLEDVIDY